MSPPAWPIAVSFQWRVPLRPILATKMSRMASGPRRRQLEVCLADNGLPPCPPALSQCGLGLPFASAVETATLLEEPTLDVLVGSVLSSGELWLGL